MHKWNYLKLNRQITGETEPQLDISCHTTWSFQYQGWVTYNWLGLSGPMGTPKQPRMLPKLIGGYPQTETEAPTAKDNTYTTHWTWRSWDGAYLVHSPLQINIHDTGRYYACYQWKKVNTNPSTHILIHKEWSDCKINWCNSGKNLVGVTNHYLI